MYGYTKDGKKGDGTFGKGLEGGLSEKGMGGFAKEGMNMMPGKDPITGEVLGGHSHSSASASGLDPRNSIAGDPRASFTKGHQGADMNNMNNNMSNVNSMNSGGSGNMNSGKMNEQHEQWKGGGRDLTAASRVLEEIVVRLVRWWMG